MTEERKGELFVVTGTFIWGLFPIVTILTYGSLPGLISLAWSILIATVFFAGVLTYKKTWRELKNTQLWKYALVIALFIGVIYYALVFTGLAKTTAGNSAIIGLFEIFTSFIFFHILRKDHISKEYILGAALMVAGAAIVLAPNFSNFNSGDILILIATFFPPIGNFYQQKARKIASGESVMFLRCLLTFPIVFAIAALFGVHASLIDLRASLIFLLINGVLIFGIQKLIWLEGIHRVSVTKALALSSVTPVATLIFAWIFLKQLPNSWQLLSLLPMILGVFLLTDQLKFNKTKIGV